MSNDQSMTRNEEATTGETEDPTSETLVETGVSTEVRDDMDPSASNGPGAARTLIEAENVNVWYNDDQALHDVSMEIPEKRVTAMIGPSGCGKSTFLRCINRMNDLIDAAHVEGSLKIRDKDVYDADVDPVALRRRVGIVFQKPNPFPKSIYDNVAYGLKIQNKPGDYDEIVERSLKRAALWEEVNDRLDESGLELSGGQQQRLCIARAIAPDPEVLLMDEPASALDPVATSQIEDLIADLAEEYTVVIVTHNMQQAARISDKTAVFLTGGELVEFDDTQQIFQNPQSQRVEDYITGKFG